MTLEILEELKENNFKLSLFFSLILFFISILLIIEICSSYSSIMSLLSKDITATIVIIFLFLLLLFWISKKIISQIIKTYKQAERLTQSVLLANDIKELITDSNDKSDYYKRETKRLISFYLSLAYKINNISIDSINDMEEIDEDLIRRIAADQYRIQNERD